MATLEKAEALLEELRVASVEAARRDLDEVSAFAAEQARARPARQHPCDAAAPACLHRRRNHLSTGGVVMLACCSSSLSLHVARLRLSLRQGRLRLLWFARAERPVQLCVHCVSGLHVIDNTTLEACRTCASACPGRLLKRQAAHVSSAWLAAQLRPERGGKLRQGFEGKLQHWDVNYWAERLREARYQLTDEQLRPYFALPNVLDGLNQARARRPSSGRNLETGSGICHMWGFVRQERAPAG